ncbi:kinase-like protein [Aspergillus egyptiacus]|nr:kinase-like protein [Aspergillus egyptiacus]
MSATRKGSPSVSVNDNRLYRCLTLLVIRILQHVRPRKGSVLMLTGGLCVKYGRRVHLSEASAMRFVSQHTYVPVPNVLCAFTRSGRTYIVMERIQGEMIGRNWVQRSETSEGRLLLQLARTVREMRNLQPPEGIRVASVDGGPLLDCRVPGPSLRFDPFDTGMEFDPRLDPEIQELIRQQSQSWPLVFTHGDLSSLNFRCAETISWVNPQNSFWVDEIDRFLQPMPDELAIERIRQKYFGVV